MSRTQRRPAAPDKTRKTGLIAAIDIGGTKTSVGLVNSCGVPVTRASFPTLVGNWQQNLAAAHARLIPQYAEAGISSGQLQGVGIALPGMYDTQRDLLIQAPFAGWTDIPVRRQAAKLLETDNVQAQNDVKACALAELLFGLGRHYSSFIWVTVSTGIGGALVWNGRIVDGVQNLAGEIGHLCVEYAHPEPCPCGRSGCLEAHASGIAIARQALREAERNTAFREQLAAHGLKADAAGCGRLAELGEPAATAIYDTACAYLARGIAAAINLFAPQAVILGGGVSRSFALMEPMLRKHLARDVVHALQDTPVLASALGYQAALIGAAALVVQAGLAQQNRQGTTGAAPGNGPPEGGYTSC